LSPFRHHAEGVDIQAGIGLVEDGINRFQNGHLENLVALLLPARKALVDGAAGELAIDPQFIHQAVKALVECHSIDVFPGTQASPDGFARKLALVTPGIS